MADQDPTTTPTPTVPTAPPAPVQPGYATPDPPPEIDTVLRKAAADNKISYPLFRSLVHRESGYNPKAYNKKSGATGLGQLMPETAKQFGVTDRTDPAANANASAKYFQSLLKKYNGDTSLALAEYNAGPKHMKEAKGGIPNITETQEYVPAVQAGAQVRGSKATGLKVQGPDGKFYQFKYGTTRQQMIDEFTKRGIRAAAPSPPVAPARPVQAKPAAAPQSPAPAPYRPMARTFGNYAEALKDAAVAVGGAVFVEGPKYLLQTARPRNEVEVAQSPYFWGFAPILLSIDHMADDLLAGAHVAAAERERVEREAPEQRRWYLGGHSASGVLASMENFPLIGDVTQRAEKGGPRMFSPESVGAGAYGAGLVAAPDITGEAAARAIKYAPKVGQALIDHRFAKLDAKVGRLDTDLLKTATSKSTDPKAVFKHGRMMAQEPIIAHLRDAYVKLPQQIEAARVQAHADYVDKVVSNSRAGRRFDANIEKNVEIAKLRMLRSATGSYTPAEMAKINAFQMQLENRWQPSPSGTGGTWVPRDWRNMDPSEALALVSSVQGQEGWLSQMSKFTTDRPNVIAQTARTMRKVLLDKLDAMDPGIKAARTREHSMIVNRDAAIKLRNNRLNGRAQGGFGLVTRGGFTGLAFYEGLRAMFGGFLAPMIATITGMRAWRSPLSMTLRDAWTAKQLQLLDRLRTHANTVSTVTGVAFGPAPGPALPAPQPPGPPGGGGASPGQPSGGPPPGGGAPPGAPAMPPGGPSPGQGGAPLGGGAMPPSSGAPPGIAIPRAPVGPAGGLPPLIGGPTRGTYEWLRQTDEFVKGLQTGMKAIDEDIARRTTLANSTPEGRALMDVDLPTTEKLADQVASQPAPPRAPKLRKGVFDYASLLSDEISREEPSTGWEKVSRDRIVAELRRAAKGEATPQEMVDINERISGRRRRRAQLEKQAATAAPAEGPTISPTTGEAVDPTLTPEQRILAEENNRENIEKGYAMLRNMGYGDWEKELRKTATELQDPRLGYNETEQLANAIAAAKAMGKQQ